MPLICRDDLRYTDEVLATLHSGMNAVRIAKLLNISLDDVLYHVNETRGMSYRGLPLVMYHDNDRHEWPTNPEWYRTRTRKEIATAMGVTRQAVLFHLRKIGIEAKRVLRREYPWRHNWPRDPEWYATKTVSHISSLLNVRCTSVYRHIRRNGLTTLPASSRRGRKRFVWPTDPAWYAERTAWEVAREMKVGIGAVKIYVKRRGLALRPEESFMVE